ncbi:DoxX family protein [Bosea sp. ASV33]|uniref:DoxX family protein n=1 Tax=Bosea sp. ASV33 TaxID=2795106 RepID=UPI0018EB8DF4|nr:DoxX family protein [Bosea sp. ASV33]
MNVETTKSDLLPTVSSTPARILAGAAENDFGKLWFGYLARTVLTFMFWSSGLAKLFDFDAGLAEMRHFGLVPEVLFYFATVITLLLGSILVILDRWTWMAAGALAAFTVLTIPIAHDFWTMEEPMSTMEFHVAMEHITVTGGLFVAIYASAIRKGSRLSMQA